MSRLPIMVGLTLLSTTLTSSVARSQTPPAEQSSTEPKAGKLRKLRKLKAEKEKAKSHSHAKGAKKYDGAELYARYCALCHGTDREGYAADEAPSLRSPELMGAAPGGFLWSAISYGRPGTPMAAFADTQGGPLSHDAQHALMDWLDKSAKVIRNPGKDEPIEGVVVAGAEVYATNCAGCHGEKGEGERVPRSPTPFSWPPLAMPLFVIQSKRADREPP